MGSMLKARVQAHHLERANGREAGPRFHSIALPEGADGGCFLAILRNRYIILPADSLGTSDLPVTYTHARTEPALAVAV